MKGKYILILGTLTAFLITTGFCIAGYTGEVNVGTAVKSDSTENPTITIETVGAVPSSTVEVNVYISQNPGILGAAFSLSYDDDLTLISAKNGEAFSALAMTKPGKFVSPCNFVWDGQEIEVGDIKDGKILTLTFEVSDAVRVSEVLDVSMTYSSGGIVDRNLEPVYPEMITGGVSVLGVSDEAPAISVDGMITESDDILLKLTSNNQYSEIYLLVAAYSTEGQMLGCDMQTITAVPGEKEYSFEKKYGDVIYKAFVLDEEFCPCSPAEPLEEIKTYTVTFVDHDGTIISSQNVVSGEDAILPKDPTRDGYVFIGWQGVYTNVTSPQTVTAQYREDTSSSVVVGSITAAPGDTDVQLPILVRNNPGILGMTLTLAYDDNALKLVSASNGDAVKNVLSMTKPGKFLSPCNFVWDGQEIEPEQVQDGVILTLTFDIPSTVPEGWYPVEVSYKTGSIIDNEFNPLTLSIQQGGINIK